MLTQTEPVENDLKEGSESIATTAPVDEIDEFAEYAADNEAQAHESGRDEAEIERPEPEEKVPAPVAPEADWEARFRALEAQIAAQALAPTPTAPVADDPLAALREDYPDWVGPIQQVLERQQQQFGAALADVQARVFEESMDAARPDWRGLRQDPDFAAWMQAHPDQQQAAQQPGVRAALGVIRAYDDHQKAVQVQAQREARLKNAQATPARGSRAPSLSDALDGWAAD